MSFFPKYYIKTALYGAFPGGFGYQRQLRATQNPDYDFARDKHPVRERHNGQTGWHDGSGDVKRREYQNYNEYVTHQKQKFEEILQLNGGFSNRTIVTWRQRFYRRFRHLSDLLPADATIVCLGARQGTEVEVLRDIGFKNAYGLDLNPGPDNPFVRAGDFMNLKEDTDTVDCIYTNSLDHAFDLDKFIAEQVRVLKPDGYALYDLPRYSGSRNPGAFEAIGWESEQDIIQQLAAHYNREVVSARERKWHWTLFQGPKLS